MTDDEKKAHQVQGHWRFNWRKPKGPAIWIPEHKRGAFHVKPAKRIRKKPTKEPKP